MMGQLTLLPCQNTIVLPKEISPDLKFLHWQHSQTFVPFQLNVQCIYYLFHFLPICLLGLIYMQPWNLSTNNKLALMTPWLYLSVNSRASLKSIGLGHLQLLSHPPQLCFHAPKI